MKKITIFCLLAFLLAIVSTVFADEKITFNPHDLIVNTQHGPIKGGALGDGSINDPKVYAWIKIPYAAPPLGDLMFMPPIDPKPWKEPLDCSKYEITINDYPMQWDWGRSYFSGKHQPIGTLDCLYLNVWRPQTTEKNLPVQVDFHGGSTENWAGLDSNEWQDYVNEANCILVAPNFRLGPWGNFSHPALKTGDPLGDSGNFATLDQLKVLKWVQDNITLFGGNPDNVTISGQSSGGLQSVYLLHSPLAKDLFHKAMISSPSLMHIKGTIEKGNNAGKKILENFLLYEENEVSTEEEAIKIAASMTREEQAAYLRKMFGGEPLLVFTAIGNGTPERPSKSDLYYWGFLDGCVINKAIDWDKNYYPKPLIIGTTETDRYNTPTIKAAGASALSDYAYAILYGKEDKYNNFEEAIKDLVDFESTPGGWKYSSVKDFLEKYYIVRNSRQVPFAVAAVHIPCRATAEAGLNAYGYRQDWGSDVNIPVGRFDGYFQLIVGADHSSDLFAMYDWNDIKGPGWFDNWTRKLIFFDENYAGRKEMTNAIQAYLKEFLHSTDGTIKKTESMPILWEPWTKDAEAFMSWNASPDAMILKMEFDTFTNDTLEAFLIKKINGLKDATPEDKNALIDYVKKAIPKYIAGEG